MLSRSFQWSALLVAATLALAGEVGAGFFGGAASSIEAITFDVEPGKVFVPLGEATRALRWSVAQDERGGPVRVNTVSHPAEAFRMLVDGTPLIAIRDLERFGATVVRDETGIPLEVGAGRRRFRLVIGPKRAEVSLANQRLRAWQGNRLVLECRVSSGRNGRTPAGDFSAGPYKAQMHYSKLYENAPMPWSVQINGHVFIHGFSSVPDYPASHGCIRVPLNEGNPAKFFYDWIDRGTPVRVVRE